MKKIVVGNLKMYMNYSDTLKYIESMKDTEAIICPSALYLPLYKDFKHVGLQDVSMYDLGSHTGDISGIQAKEMGIDYTIIGHSERRNKEDNKLINLKIIKALECGLKVILCVGEKENENKEIIIKQQLLESLLNINDLNNIIIAYEPIWCIGQGRTPTSEQIKTTITYIQTILSQKSMQSAKILYGGSVDINNIDNLLKIENIDGFLIGKAATEVEQLKEIIKKT